MAIIRQTLQRLSSMTTARLVPAAQYHEKVGIDGAKNVPTLSMCYRLLTTMRIPAMWVRWIPRESMSAQG